MSMSKTDPDPHDPKGRSVLYFFEDVKSSNSGSLPV